MKFGHLEQLLELGAMALEWDAAWWLSNQTFDVLLHLKQQWMNEFSHSLFGLEKTNYHLKSWACQWSPSKLIFTLLKYGTLGNTNCSSNRRPTTYSLWRLWVGLLPSSHWVFKMVNLTILHHWHKFCWTLQLFITRIDLGLCCRGPEFLSLEASWIFVHSVNLVRNLLDL